MQSMTHAITKYFPAHCYQLYCSYNKENHHLCQCRAPRKWFLSQMNAC